jgi:hypothetical protein
MIREAMKNHYIGMNKEFRYRGEEATRVETLSDACFALAIGLLLISTSPPTNFDQLMQFTRDLIPFAICMVLISLVWYEHFKFFVRYGFRNGSIVALNTVLLFLILFYVYPLKFLFRLLIDIYGALFGRMFGFDISMKGVFDGVIDSSQMPFLMVTYGLGASGIFIVLMLMYRYAYKRAVELELTQIEIFDTKMSIQTNLLMASVPLFSSLLALIIPNSLWAATISGFVYFLYIPIMMIFSKRVDKARKGKLGVEALATEDVD